MSLTSIKMQIINNELNLVKLSFYVNNHVEASTNITILLKG